MDEPKVHIQHVRLSMFKNNKRLIETAKRISYVYHIYSATRVQILDETDCISHSTNTLGKGMNPIILPPAMGK